MSWVIVIGKFYIAADDSWRYWKIYRWLELSEEEILFFHRGEELKHVSDRVQYAVQDPSVFLAYYTEAKAGSFGLPKAVRKEIVDFAVFVEENMNKCSITYIYGIHPEEILKETQREVYKDQLRLLQKLESEKETPFTKRLKRIIRKTLRMYEKRGIGQNEEENQKPL